MDLEKDSAEGHKIKRIAQRGQEQECGRMGEAQENIRLYTRYSQPRRCHSVVTVAIPFPSGTTSLSMTDIINNGCETVKTRQCQSFCRGLEWVGDVVECPR